MSSFEGFDHIDCRVPELAAVESFYDRLLPALGLPRKRYAFVDAEGNWHTAKRGKHNTIEFAEERSDGTAARFMGVIEDRQHVITSTRIAFRVARTDLDRWERLLPEIGARAIDRESDPAYPAIFFEDPAGTKLELLGR